MDPPGVDHAHVGLLVGLLLGDQLDHSIAQAGEVGAVFLQHLDADCSDESLPGPTSSHHTTNEHNSF
jgi:hypothetical protein